MKYNKMYGDRVPALNFMWVLHNLELAEHPGFMYELGWHPLMGG